MIRYRSEQKIHPLDGKQAIRQAYVELLRKIADDIDQTPDMALPGVIAGKLEDARASDYLHLQMYCFQSSDEVARAMELFFFER